MEQILGSKDLYDMMEASQKDMNPHISWILQADIQESTWSAIQQLINRFSLAVSDDIQMSLYE